MISEVKWFNDDKGYGFIKFNEGEDIFVHYSAINMEGFKTLIKGKVVEFELVETLDGYKAKNVRSIKKLEEESV